MRAATPLTSALVSIGGADGGLPNMVDAMFAVSGGRGGACVVGGIGCIRGGASLSLYRTHTPIRQSLFLSLGSFR